MQIIEELPALPVDGILLSDEWAHQPGAILGSDHCRDLLEPYLPRTVDLVRGRGQRFGPDSASSRSAVPQLGNVP